MASDTLIPSPSSLDLGQLHDIRAQVRAGSHKGDAAVAQQFEALFIQQLLKQARAASPTEGGLLDSPQTRLAQSLSDEQVAQQLATPGIGLAQALLAQMQSAQSSKD